MSRRPVKAKGASAIDPRPGDRPWLVPRTLGAPSAAYRQPQVTVIAVDFAYVTVRLPLRPGQQVADEVTTVKANLSYSRPRPPAERVPTQPRRPALALAPGEEEATLW